MPNLNDAEMDKLYQSGAIYYPNIPSTPSIPSTVSPQVSNSTSGLYGGLTYKDIINAYGNSWKLPNGDYNWGNISNSILGLMNTGLAGINAINGINQINLARKQYKDARDNMKNNWWNTAQVYNNGLGSAESTAAALNGNVTNYNNMHSAEAEGRKLETNYDIQTAKVKKDTKDRINGIL